MSLYIEALRLLETSSYQTTIAQRMGSTAVSDGAGVAQHSQGDFEAAQQAFSRASQQALEAADMSSPSPGDAARSPEVSRHQLLALHDLTWLIFLTGMPRK